jgi:signal transduction histidine kinase
MGQRVRLADFILANVEPILVEWEKFARALPAAAKMDRAALRDHAEEILRATARDMASAQTADQQADKSRGQGDAAAAVSEGLDKASEVHAVGRAASGFELLAVVAEYRALRASVIRLWRQSMPDPDRNDLDDVTRFNESIDQSLAEAVRSHTRQLDRSRQLFLAILGHDLRNPLNSMMMSAELLAHEPALASVVIAGAPEVAAAEAARQIKTSAAAMDRMIRDLLDFTGAALGGGMPLTPTHVDLAQLCREVVAEMHAAHPRCAIDLSLRGDMGAGAGAGAGDFTGEWDASRLRQLVSNLLGNAIQHGEPECPIALSLTGEPADVVLAVRNQGPPIPEEMLTTIFDPLVRVVSPQMERRRRPGSIGLGLYIAREVVTAHGGSVDVKSSDEEGTVFTARLPRRRRGPHA